MVMYDLYSKEAGPSAPNFWGILYTQRELHMDGDSGKTAVTGKTVVRRTKLAVISRAVDRWHGNIARMGIVNLTNVTTALNRRK